MPSFREAQLRHAVFYLDFAKKQIADLAALDKELDENILTGVETCLIQENWQLLAEFTKTLNSYWVKSGPWNHYLKYNHILLDRNVFKKNNEKIEVLGQLAAVEEARGNYAEARHLLRQQVLTIDQSGAKDNDILVRALRQLVRLATQQGDYSEAQLFSDRLLMIARNQQNLREQVDILLERAALYQKENDLNKANSFCLEGLAIARSLGYTVGMIDTLKQQASIRSIEKFLEDARNIYQEALGLAVETGDQIRVSEIRQQLAILEATMGRNIFISYNNRDREFVERLAYDLKSTGLAVWWDEWEIKVGDSIIQKVSEGIKGSAYLAVVLSPHSVQSTWVQREIGSVLMKQLSAERNITILPLLFTDCEVPVLLREIKWADFRFDYQAGLRELLSALNG